MLQQPPLTISSSSYQLANQSNMLHLVFYHKQQQILKRICDLRAIEGSIVLNCDSQSRDFQMSQPSHLVKVNAFKFAILTNNTYLLIVSAQQDNKNLHLINLFSEQQVKAQIGEKQNKDTCTIEILGMATNNEHQGFLQPNEIPSKQNNILIALYRCEKGKVYLMEYDTFTSTIVQFSEQFKEIIKEPKRILDLTPKEPPPDDKSDNNKGKSEPNPERDPSKFSDEKESQLDHKNIENSQMHFSVLPYSNQIVAQQGDQVQTIQLGSTITRTTHKIISQEISNLTLHFFETSQADTTTRQLPFAIALGSVSMSIFSALCPSPNSIYFSSQQQCMSTSCNENMSYLYQPKKLKQEICLNNQANTLEQLVQVVLIICVLLLGVAWISLFVYKKYYKKEDLLGLREDPRKLLSNNNNNVEIQEYEQNPNKDQEPVSIYNSQAIMDPLEKQQSRDIESSGKKLVSVERQENHEFSEKKEQQQQTVQSSQSDLISQKCLNSSTPTPQFDLESSSSASLSSKKSQRHSELNQNHHHKSDQKQEYFFQTNSKQNNDGSGQQSNHILKSSYYNNQMSYEQTMQVNQLQEQNKQMEFPIPNAKEYSNKYSHAFNPFASNQESNANRSPLISENVSQNSQSSSDPLIINQQKSQQSYLRLLQCSQVLQQSKQSSSEAEDNQFEVDQNALKAFEDALNDYIEDRSSDPKPPMSIIQKQEQQEIPNNNKENSIENMANDDHHQNQNDKINSDNIIQDIKLLLSDDALLLQNGSINPFQLAESIIKRASEREQIQRQSQVQQQYQLLQNGSKSVLGCDQEVQISQINKNKDNNMNSQSNYVKQNRIESGEGKYSKITQILASNEGDNRNDNQNEQQIIIQRNQEAENDPEIKEFEDLTPYAEINKNKGKYPNLNKKNEKQQQKVGEQEEDQQQKLKILESTENECPICQSNPKNCTLYKCGHRLCSNCANEIQEIAKNQKSTGPPICPLCRTEILDIVMNFG